MSARRLALVVALALGLMAGGIAVGSGEEPAPSEAATGAIGDTTVLLRIGGDDLTATTLVPEIAQAYLDDRGATNIRMRPAAPPWTTEIAGDQLSGKRIAVLVRGTSSRDGIRQLARGDVDIAVTGRELTQGEVAMLAPLGDMTDPAVTAALARTAIVIAVHPDNPVSTLSFEQLRDIYAGRITDWAAVGGTPGPIHAFGRSLGSAARESVERNIMGDAPFSPDVRNARAFTLLHDHVAADPSAIGYLPITRLEKLKALQLTERGSHARPDDYGVATGDYPLGLTMRLYRSPKRTSETDKFFAEATSTQLEVAVLFAGFSRIKPQLLVPKWPDRIPHAYRDSVRNALRVSVTIRFAPDSHELDVVAIRELNALARYLRLLNVSPRKLRHLAFSEDSGDPHLNMSIAEALGGVVAEELRRRQVKPGEVLAFGATMPLASDQIPAGRQRNRRVETWILP